MPQKTLREPQPSDFTSIVQGPSGLRSVIVIRSSKEPLPGKEPVARPPISVSGFTLVEKEARIVELAIQEVLLDFHHKQLRFADELREETRRQMMADGLVTARRTIRQTR